MLSRATHYVIASAAWQSPGRVTMLCHKVRFREILSSRVINCAFDQPIVASGSRLSYACILLFPTGTQYPAGSPITSLLKSHYKATPQNDVKRVARNKKPTKKHPFGCLNINSPKTARI